MVNLIKGLTTDGIFSFCLIDGTQLLKEVTAVHGYDTSISYALTNLLMATEAMRAFEKDENIRISVMLSGDGKVSKMASYVAQDGLIGFCDHSTTSETDSVQPRNLFGDQGQMAIIKEYGNGMRSTGQTALRTDNIVWIFQDYYQYSEQQRTLIAADYSPKDHSHLVLFMLNILPSEGFASDEYDMIEVLKALEYITIDLVNGFSLEQALQNSIRGLGKKITYDINKRDDIHYHCNCSRQKMSRALLSLGVDQLTELRNEDGGAEMNCHFCNKKYYFNESDLNILIEEITK